MGSAHLVECWSTGRRATRGSCDPKPENNLNLLPGMNCHSPKVLLPKILNSSVCTRCQGSHDPEPQNLGVSFGVSGVGALGYVDMERSYLYPNLGLRGLLGFRGLGV